jgi:hypothetical protein
VREKRGKRSWRRHGQVWLVPSSDRAGTSRGSNPGGSPPSRCSTGPTTCWPISRERERKRTHVHIAEATEVHAPVHARLPRRSCSPAAVTPGLRGKQFSRHERLSLRPMNWPRTKPSPSVMDARESRRGEKMFDSIQRPGKIAGVKNC